jgi:hypothetical protein
MIVCSNCTHHLAPLVVSITDAEIQALGDTLLKTHELGSITENSITHHNVTKASVMPEQLIGLYQRARQFREEIDALVFPK